MAIHQRNIMLVSQLLFISVLSSVILKSDGKTQENKVTGCFAGADIKQLLDEVEHDIMNYQNRGQCYLLKPKAEADNTDTRF